MYELAEAEIFQFKCKICGIEDSVKMNFFLLFFFLFLVILSFQVPNINRRCKHFDEMKFFSKMCLFFVFEYSIPANAMKFTRKIFPSTFLFSARENLPATKNFVLHSSYKDDFLPYCLSLYTFFCFPFILCELFRVLFRWCGV